MYKEGQIIKCTVLQGSNAIVSRTMVDYLKVCAIDGDRIEIPGNKEFAMKVLDGELIEETMMLRVVMTAMIVKI